MRHSIQPAVQRAVWETVRTARFANQYVVRHVCTSGRTAGCTANRIDAYIAAQLCYSNNLYGRLYSALYVGLYKQPAVQTKTPIPGLVMITEMLEKDLKI